MVESDDEVSPLDASVSRLIVLVEFEGDQVFPGGLVLNLFRKLRKLEPLALLF